MMHTMANLNPFSFNMFYAKGVIMSEKYAPLEVDVDVTGTSEGIIEILETTIKGIRDLKGKIRLVMKLREKV